MAEIERTERLLALILLHQMGDASQQKKIVELNLAGFSNTEIADLLDTTTAVVAQSLYTARRRAVPGRVRRGHAPR
jgi:DNA-directed RNA polymerase specialized sigma24 family protein